MCFFVCVNTDIDVGLKKTKNGEKKKRRRVDLFCFFSHGEKQTHRKNRK